MAGLDPAIDALLSSAMKTHGRIAYQTHGTLNAAADNCIVLPTFYAGTDQSYLPVIGPGQPLDPTKYFIVVPNMLGNGVSSSPSNDPGFAQATIRENVHLQHALLTSLGVTRIRLVYGWSMGAMQALTWAALYPRMVGNLLAVCGTAKCWPLNDVFLQGLRGTMEAGQAAFGRAYAGWAYSAAFYRDALYQGMGFPTLEDFLLFWEGDHVTWHDQDLLAMLWTWQHADLGAGELANITARTIIMPCNTDMYFTVDEARIEALAIPNAEFRIIASPYGHCAGAPGRFPAETTLINAAMQALLET